MIRWISPTVKLRPPTTLAPLLVAVGGVVDSHEGVDRGEKSLCYAPPVQLARKATEYLNEVQDVLRPITEFRLRQIERDVSSTLSKVSPDDAVLLYAVLGWVQYRRGGSALEEAYRSFVKADRLKPGAGYAHRAAAVLVDLGRPEEALRLLEKPDGGEIEPDHHRVIHLGNQAHAHVLLGNVDRAQELLAEAVEATDKSDVASVSFLSIACADAGYRREAVEFLARAAALLQDETLEGPARDYVAAHEDLVRPLLDIHPGLRRAVLDDRRFEGFADALPWAPAHADCGEQDDDMALAVFEETRAARTRANVEVLGVEEP